MKRILILLVIAVSLFATERTILFTELSDSRFSEFAKDYNRQFHDIWAADSGVEIIAQDLVDQLRYRSPEHKIKLDAETQKFLKKYEYDSVFVVVPLLETFEIKAARGKGFPGIAQARANGKLVVRYRFVDLITKQTLYTGVAESDTSISLGTTMVRPVAKSVNISAAERDEIARSLINLNVRESYRLLTIYKNDLERDTAKEDSSSSANK